MRGVRWLVAVTALVAPMAVLRAADPAPPAAPAGEVGPEIYYLEDDTGRLVPVPGFRYRDFMELFRLREGLPAALEPPPAVLESLVVRCDLTRANADTGTCPATVTCVVRQTRAGWARLALGLDGLVLAKPPAHEGPGAAVVDADPDGGYRGWFDAPSGAGDVRHTLELEGTMAVEIGEARDTLALRLPAATTATVEIRTARPGPGAAVVPEPPGRPTVTAGTDGTSTVSIAGVSGPVRIRIGTAGTLDEAWAAVPQATVESVVRIDGRTAFFNAAIRLDNLPPGTAMIDVALPPRTVLRGVRPPAAVVSRGGTDDAPTAAIAIERGRDGRAVAELECERPVDPSGTAAFEAIGFAVAQVEAWRQWGRVSLAVEGDWRAEWSDRPGIRRVDPPAGAARPAPVAAFAYDALPASLPVRVRPRVSRVVVEPEYRFDVGATRIALQARLQVAARGAPATALVLQIDPDFEIEEVGPAGVVDATAVAVEGGRVTIPFLQPLSGDAVVELRGTRGIDRDARDLSWRVPVPRADVVAPASVVVTADSDIELLPDATGSVGLVRQTSGGRSGAAGEAALVYRMDGTNGVFAASRRYLARQVDARIGVLVRIDEAETEVTGTMRLDVAHVPLEYLELVVPERVLETETLEVRQDGTLLDPVAVAPTDDLAPLGPASGDGTAVPARLLRVVLTDALLGSGEVTVAYRLPTPSVPPETTVAFDLPLVVPAGARIERESVSLETADRFAADVRGDGWRSEVAGDEAGRSWSAARPHDTLPVSVATRQRAAVEAVVEAAWLRTQVLPDRREDEATFVVVGGGEGTSVAVPAATDAVTCTVSLDGAPLPATRDVAGRLAVTLPRAPAGRRRILEVRTTTARASGWVALVPRLGLPEPLRLEPPVFGAGVAARRFYWEILARPDEHVLGVPESWTAQQRWRLGRLGFERVTAVEPGALAAWIRTAAGDAVPPVAEPALVAGRSVFSGLGSPGAATLWLVPTWCAVLVASGIALAVGLALAYSPVARRTAVVVPLVFTLGVVAAALPDLAPLAAQAALPGVVLALVSWGLRAVLDREPRSPASRVPPAPVSASSLTRAVPTPSLVVTGSSLEREGSVTAGGRSSS